MRVPYDMILIVGRIKTKQINKPSLHLNDGVPFMLITSNIYLFYFLFIFFSYVYFRHKKSIYNKIYIQLDKIYVKIYNNAIRSIRSKKGDFKENIFIMLQCRTTNSKCLRRLEPRSHK